MKTRTNDHFKPNLQLIITFFMAVAIILTGSLILEIIGNRLVASDTTVKTYSINDNDYYMFYTQSDSDITLFPWNYYNPDGVIFDDYFNELTQDYEYDYNIDDYVDFFDLYDSIRYYFYQSIPSVKQYVTEKDSSLYELMDFDNIFQKIVMTKDTSGIYYFYNEDIDINNQTYHIAFALNSKFEILSFKCSNKLDPNAYTEDIINSGKKSITSFINENQQINLNLLITDLKNRAGILTSYQLEHNPETDEYTVDVLDQIYDVYDESEQDFAVSTPTSYSYQIVETENDIMIIILDANIVIHFDPVMQVFTGFNLIYN